MTNHSHVHTFDPDSTTLDAKQLSRIERKVNELIQQGVNIMSSLADLGDKVQNQETVTGGIVTLIGDLSTRIRDLADDPEGIRALADEIDNNTNKLTNAIIENTDVDEEPLPDGTKREQTEEPRVVGTPPENTSPVEEPGVSNDNPSTPMDNPAKSPRQGKL